MHKIYSQLKGIDDYVFSSYGNGREYDVEYGELDYYYNTSTDVSYGEGRFGFGNGNGEFVLIDHCSDIPAILYRTIFTFHAPGELDA